MKDINRVLNPTNRYDQITGSMDFICEHAGYDSPIGTKRWYNEVAQNVWVDIIKRNYIDIE